MTKNHKQINANTIINGIVIINKVDKNIFWRAYLQLLLKTWHWNFDNYESSLNHTYRGIMLHWRIRICTVFAGDERNKGHSAIILYNTACQSLSQRPYSEL